MNEGLQLLRDMVSVYAPSGVEERLVDYLEPTMTEMGYRTVVDEVGNIIGCVGKGEVTVALIGHLDTVPGEIDVRVEGGDLYGRGTVDAQGPLAAFIDVGREFRGSGHLSVIVAGVVEEETTSKGAYEIVDEIDPDYVVVGEPSSWNGITLGYRGSLIVGYQLASAKSHRGKNSPIPAERAVEFFRDFKGFLDNGKTGYFGNDVRLTAIKTGDNPFYDKVTMKLNVRMAPHTDLNKVMNWIGNYGGPAEIDISQVVPPVRASKKNTLVSAFLGGIREQGGKPQFKLKTGTADMNIFAANWDIPIIAYGPGDSSMDHTPDEHLDLQEYHKARKVLRSALGKLEEKDCS